MKTWTFEQEKILKDKYPTNTAKQLQKLFPDKTEVAIRSRAKRLGIKKVKQKFRFTPGQLEELIRDFPTTLSADLAKRFGCQLCTIHNVSHRLKLKKDPNFIREVAKKNFTEDHPARKFFIKKGNVPVNKGKKQTEYMTAEAIERTKATRFKKGQLPSGTLYDYAITERHDKSGRIYKYIRIGLAKWVPYHRYIWEQKNGKIPKGYNIQFKDGNTLNCAIDNLYMISRAEQLKNENSVHARYPEDIKQLIYLKGALNRQINKIEKKNGSN